VEQSFYTLSVELTGLITALHRQPSLENHKSSSRFLRIPGCMFSNLVVLFLCWSTLSPQFRCLLPNSNAIEASSCVSLVEFKSLKAMLWLEEDNVPCVLNMSESSQNISLLIKYYIKLWRNVSKGKYANLSLDWFWPSTMASSPGLNELICLPRPKPVAIHWLLYNEPHSIPTSLPSASYLSVCMKRKWTGLRKILLFLRHKANTFMK
jgi:hypothetical protein